MATKRPKTEKLSSTGVSDRKWLIVIAAFAFLLYANTLGHEYALDDFPTIYGNQLTMDGVRSIPTLMTTAYWFGLDGQNDWLYRPLSMIMFAAEWQLTDGKPWLGHLINVLLYALTSVVLFKFLRLLFVHSNELIPLAVTLLWVVHPTHTEVVANIKSRDELLAMLFALLALQSSLRYVRDLDKKEMIKTGLWYVLAMFSKESPIMLLFIAPITWFVFSEAPWRRMIMAMVPLASAAGFYLLVRASVLTSQTGSEIIPLIDNALVGAPDFIHRQAMAFYVLGMYLRLLFFPMTMSSDYSFKQIPEVGFDHPGALISLLLTVVLVMYGLWRTWKKDVLGYSILFYLLGVVLVSNIFFLTRSTAADRFLYFPSVGFCLAIVLILSRWLKMDASFNPSVGLFNRVSRKPAFIFIMLLMLIPGTVRTITRNRDWKNDTTLFSADVVNAPNSARIHFLHANHLIQDIKQGKTAASEVEYNFSEALTHFNLAIKIHPKYYEALNGLADAYASRNRFDEAMKTYELAVEAHPFPADAYNNMGNLCFKRGQYDKGIAFLKKAIEISPNYAQAYNNLGTCYFGKGEYETALEHLHKAASLSPRYADAVKNLGSTYGMMNDIEKSTEFFLKAFELNPKDVDVAIYLEMNYKNLGNAAQSAFFKAKVEELTKFKQN